jgi:predicted RNA polymerase sigma factor
MTDQMVFSVVNPFLRDHQKSALHLREFDVLSAANLARMFGSITGISRWLLTLRLTCLSSRWEISR